MIPQHATPPRFGTQPLEQDDLFALPPRTCQDCGEEFRTSKPASRCATCASLRSGPVGPATVECPACGVEHQIPILSPTKFCGPCRTDLVMTKGAVEAELEAAHIRAGEAKITLTDALAHAAPADRARYDAAVEARASGIWQGKQYKPETIERLWATALAANDGLAALLAAHDAQLVAEQTLTQAVVRGGVALAEIARVQG